MAHGKWRLLGCGLGPRADLCLWGECAEARRSSSMEVGFGSVSLKLHGAQLAPGAEAAAGVAAGAASRRHKQYKPK